MSDGGEGLLDVLGGANRTLDRRPGRSARRSRRRGGSTAARRSSRWPRPAGWRSPAAPRATTRCGASTIGHRRADRPGPRQGARSIIVGLGGSATTDGGLGAIEALRSPARLRVDRAARWPATCAPGSSTPPPCSRRRRAPRRPRSALLTARLERLAQRYARRVRRRRPRARRRRRGRRAGRRAGRARRPAASAGSTSSPSTSSSTSASPPPTSSSPARATSTRRASTARSSAACASSPPAAGAPVVVIVGDADADVAATLEPAGRASRVRLARRARTASERRLRRAALVHRARRRRRDCAPLTRVGPPASAGDGRRRSPPATARRRRRSPRSRSASVLPAVSVPSITSTVAVPSAAVDRRRDRHLGRPATPPMSAATSVGHGLGGGVADDVVDDRRVERAPVDVAGARPSCSRRSAAPSTSRRPSRRCRWRWRRRRSPPAFGDRLGRRRRGRRRRRRPSSCRRSCRPAPTRRRRAGVIVVAAVVVVVGDRAEDQEPGDHRDTARTMLSVDPTGEPRVADAWRAALPLLRLALGGPVGCVGHAMCLSLPCRRSDVRRRYVSRSGPESSRPAVQVGIVVVARARRAPLRPASAERVHVGVPWSPCRRARS